ncbi:hypothetical protein AGRO_4359 [Agrobacterium sp. ATCC 31749]|nr:hypothetical protein AGRO_4359 [Agrobacterium sp. ATCC 31749]
MEPGIQVPGDLSADAGSLHNKGRSQEHLE